MKSYTDIEQSKKLELVNKEYNEALRRFRKVEQERNKLQNLIVLPEYKKNIGKCYCKSNAGIDSDDELARYRFIKITDAVYEPEGFFYSEPRYVGIVFGMGIKGSLQFMPESYITIDKDCKEITSEKYNEEYTRFVNKLLSNSSYVKKS